MPSWRDRFDLDLGWRATLCAVAAVIVGLGLVWPDHRVPAIGVICLTVGCWPFLAEAFDDLCHAHMSMELSMLCAIAAAAAIGEWVTALMITTFVLVAEILEDLSMERGRDALTDLMAFLPDTVRVRRNDGIVDTALAELTVGDLIVISPGDRVAVDGLIQAGRSEVDQSRITGEPMPVTVREGDRVLAGSVNHGGAIEVRVEQIGANSSYGQIVEAVRSGQDSPTPVQRLSDRVATWIVAAAFLAAIITWFATHDLRATISVIVVAGACGVAAGTPLAILAGMARVARRGAFVKGGVHLEQLGQVDTVVIDKTGTITAGQPTVSKVDPAAGWADDDVLSLAASVEQFSEHPVGRAICAASDVTALMAEDFRYEPGHGVSGVVGGRRVEVSRRVPAGFSTDAIARSYVWVDDEWIGAIQFVDEIRETSAAAIEELHRMGLQVVMLSGDAEATARQVGDQVGVDEVRAGLRPIEKADVISELMASGRKVVMVGDGVNDAPALSAATVGVGMGAGTEIARRSADVVLISSDLADLAGAVRTARRVRGIIWFNVVGTLAVDVLGMVLAATGALGPLGAALVHVGSETAFILNSARLIPTGFNAGERRRPESRISPVVRGAAIHPGGTASLSLQRCLGLDVPTEDRAGRRHLRLCLRNRIGTGNTSWR
ncbi:cadmium-translocating P-type ATPase [Cutibacterium avidum]|uniref:heavy metal translocating P-type ATPase n=1 Tax=Cutibacterium avidum TaxID=33010 RepID=UPI0009BCE2D0|nr:cation-translocating P-type ATPase [Cutibacterium avidum]MCO6659602.1 cadmium-translocating P-type ATPase [Cutibacterium avidum]MCO6664033.1 cadmium-translocating P-type ATPase [Cutibacterium avidum]MCT1417102.1 cadmium-translocating P-type ATPase [Cutibacterium avidum]MCX8467287.1 cadmium-translocating P-type ATPase [Cutibacterium avidum]MCX8469233.1 cadmium-translocating P-type ATPase [Cutibacterium avidum]